jgi:cold shock CspA family protein
MRTHGTLVKWNDERGFGFIAPAQGSDELFVHVSAFRRGGARPRVSELVSFEIRIKPDGKKEAINVMRAGEASRPTRGRSTRDAAAPRSGLIGSALSLAAVAAIGLVGYNHYFGRRDAMTAPMAESAGAAAVSDRHRALPRSSPESAAASSRTRPTFVCDGRSRCSQMSSCEEARFFVQHCPNTEMDGDGDGEPCESQCGH